jgi:hypothetical protein
MFSSRLLLTGLGFLLFASFSSSTTYNLQTYSIGSGSTNSASSPSYKLQGSTGETVGGTASSTNFKSKSGAIQAEQANVPSAPTLSNGGGTYYNELGFTINPNTDPTDYQFALAVSTTSGFISTSYVQASGTLGGSQVYQTYATWVAGGSLITGLAPNTTYYVKVAAMHGLFTNSAFGPSANATTVNPSITFSLSPTSQNLGSLLPGTVVTGGSDITYNLATNANFGAIIYVSGTYAGLYSTAKNYTIPAISANLTGQSQGFGLQGVSASSPLVIDSPFNVTGNTVGAESTTNVPMFTTPSSISSGTASAALLAKASNLTPASPDYQEILTFVAAASF